MIAILVVTHIDLGREFIKAAEFIVGRIEASGTISITETTNSDKIRKKIEERIEELDTGDGVLILTDMFGGTPSNLSLSFLQKDRVEVLTGVNLPMIIFIHQNRSGMSLQELAEKAQDAGKAGISLAGKLLEME
ncbi:MAG: PTS fructose transporter subunit IIA [Desulfobacteraceae bacterium]|jgi:PTS system mannose-specific IIA component